MSEPTLKVWLEKIRPALLPLLALLSTAAVFFPALENDFVTWDDNAMLAGNVNYRGLGARELRWMFTTFYMGHYQPLSWVTFALDYRVWGLNPYGFHLTNVLLHALNAALFYFVALRLLALSNAAEKDTRLRFGALFAALLFALHPLRVESIAWVTERRDALSGAFFFLTLLAYLRAASAPSAARSRWLVFAVATYALSLLSKATAMALPVVLVVLDIYPLKRLGWSMTGWFDRGVRKVWLEKLPFVLPAAATAVAAAAAQYSSGAMDTLAKHGALERLAQASFGSMYYVGKTFFPARVYPMYDLPMTLSPWQPVYVVSFFSVVAVTVLLFLQRRRWPAVFAAWICYAALIAPVSGIAQSGSQIVADRYTYLSCLSWALITAGAALDIRRRLPEKPSAGIAMSALAIAILSTLAFLTHKQISVWRDSESLYEYALANTPRPSKIAFNNLGGVLADGGELDRAIPYFRRALEIDPNFDDARLNLGNALVAQGKLDEAIAQYRKVLRRVPDSLAVHHDLGLALAKKGNIEEAMEHYRKALEIDSSFVEGHSNLGLLLAAKGRYPEAISEYREALKLKPDFAVAHVNWGDVLLATGDRQAAIQHFRKALELDPNLGSARSSLAKALAAEPRVGASLGQ